MVDEEILARIARDPRYHALVRSRSRFAWSLATMVLAAFVGFTCVVALDKQLLATPVGEHAMSWGIPVGFGMILLAISSIAIFITRCAQDYDPRMQSIIADAKR